MMAPFVHAEGSEQAPLVSFDKPISSVSVSGHKFLGAPLPCGVVVTRLRCAGAPRARAQRRAHAHARVRARTCTHTHSCTFIHTSMHAKT